MCGIIGYLGPQEAMPIILDGLKRLEYRGYDSAGMAVIGGQRPGHSPQPGKTPGTGKSRCRKSPCRAR